jgi:hypothetical protein
VIWWFKGTKNYSPGAGTPTWGYKICRSLSDP